MRLIDVLDIWLYVQDGRTVESVNLVNTHGWTFHRKDLAEAQGNEIWPGRRAARKNTRQWIIPVAPWMHPPDASLLDCVVPVEPVHHKCMRITVQTQKCVGVFVEYSQLCMTLVLFDSAHGT